MSDVDTMNKKPSAEELLAMHAKADAMVVSYSYTKPSIDSGKGRVNLGRTDNIRGVVQIVSKNGGENNLHYHTNSDSFWMVLKGRVRFYGPEDKVIGEFGPNEGTFTPRYSRYWFENAGDDDAELLQVSAMSRPGLTVSSGRTDIDPQRYQIGNTPHFDARKK